MWLDRLSGDASNDGAALLCSSRAGFDMWLLSRKSIVHRDWGRTIGVCLCSFVVVVVVVGFLELYGPFYK